MPRTDDDRPQGAAAEGLGFDLPTIAREAFAGWPIVAGVLLLALPAAVAAALLLGTRRYEAETVLLYRPVALVPTTDGTGEGTVDLRSMVDMVKLRSNLEQVRQRLKLPMSLEQLGAAVQARIQGKTDLLVIQAAADNAAGAAQLCTTVRDVFLSEQAKRVRADGARTLRKQRDETLRDVATLTKQSTDLDERIAELRRQVDREREAMRRKGSASRVERRLRQLQDDIRQETAVRRDAIDLDVAQQAYDRVKTLAARGVSSPRELAEARAAYEKARTLAGDSAKLANIRAEVAKLQGSGDADGAGGQLTASELMLQQALARSIELGLKWVAAKEKAAFLTTEAQRIETLPIDPAKSETSFRVMSQPAAQQAPASSTRRLIFAGVAAGALLLALGLTVGRAVLTSKLRSPGELRLKVAERLLGVLPRSAGASADPLATPSAPEALRLLATRLREQVSRHGARVLVSSADHGAGRTTIVQALATGLARLGMRVAVVDLDLPGRPAAAPPAKPGAPAVAWPAPPEGALTLAGALTAAADPARLTLSPHPDGFDLLAAGPPAVPLEALGSPELRRLLAALAERYDCVLVDGSPILPYADTELVAPAVDGLVLVVRAGLTTTPEAQRALRRVGAAELKVLGVVLNAVHRRHLARADASGGST